MGHRTITVYTGNDVNSQLVICQLKARNLTFQQVPVDPEEAIHLHPHHDHHHRFDQGDEVQNAAAMPFVPRIFFGNRPVSGNIQEGLARELKRLDRRRQMDPRRKDRGGNSSSRRLERGVRGGEGRRLAPRRASPRGVDEDEETTPVLEDVVEEEHGAHHMNLKRSFVSSSSASLSTPSVSFNMETEPEAEAPLPFSSSFDRTSHWSTVDKVVASCAWTVPKRMEWLKSLELSGDVRVEGTLYKNAFLGQDLVDKLIQEPNALCLVSNRNEAKSFINKTLLEQKFLCRINTTPSSGETTADQDPKSFDPEAVYRWQCHDTPDILNSYCLWSGVTTTSFAASDHPQDPETLVHDLLHCLNDLELHSVIRNCASSPKKDLKEVGFLDYERIPAHGDFPAFEASLCQLQRLALPSKDDNRRLAFGLNLYHLMMRYFFVKQGFPLSEDDRQHMMQHAKFYAGQGNLVSFAGWEQELFEMSGRDPRIHVALQTGLLGGSNLSLPFVAFVPDHVDEQLEMAAQTFLADPNFAKVIPNDNDDDSDEQAHNLQVQLSNVFEHHRSDFGDGTDMALLEFTLQYHLNEVGKNATKSTDFAALYDTLHAEGEVPALRVTFSDPVIGAQAARALWYDREARTLENSENGSLRANLVKFSPAPMSSDERSRLTTLHNLHMLDTLAHEGRFDRITQKAAEAFDVPIVLVSLVDRDRQWFKSAQWNITAPPAPQTTRDISFCGHAILQPDLISLPKNHNRNELFVIPNALEDERFTDNPLVTGPVGIRFYAACSLQVPTTNADGSEEDGSTQNIGTLCLIDQKPRPNLSPKEETQLRRFAELVQFELTAEADDEDDINFLSDSDEDDRAKSTNHRRIRSVRDE